MASDDARLRLLREPLADRLWLGLETTEILKLIKDCLVYSFSSCVYVILYLTFCNDYGDGCGLKDERLGEYESYRLCARRSRRTPAMIARIRATTQPSEETLNAVA